MKEKIIWAGHPYELEWVDNFNNIILNDLQQVYGFLFTNERKICITRPNSKQGWRLAGGGPEEEDKDWRDTIIREASEEADIDLDYNSLKILGVIKITPSADNCERKLGYALRVTGKVTAIHKQTEDIAIGEIGEREFIDPKDFLYYCEWGEIGKLQLEKALEAFKHSSYK